MSQLVAGLSRAEWHARLPLLDSIAAAEEALWINPDLRSVTGRRICADLDLADVHDAERRLERFAPYLAEVFPEVRASGGIIESALRPLPRLRAALCREGQRLQGALYVKADSHLPIAGSVKARGGIYEVLTHAERIALNQGGLRPDENYAVLASEKYRNLFSRYAIGVGSTGNLGLSIGIMGARLGFSVTVHMSADAKEWKKNLLRARGARVVEHHGDYGAAVAAGRAQAEGDPFNHFVDDENSQTLFLGYAVAALRLQRQIVEAGLRVDAAHPLFVYLPCGVGGAPGGITFGLRLVFGDAVHCFFAEPTQAPAMLLGLMTGKHHEVSALDFGLSNRTDADGLAVARPSGFVGRTLIHDISGVYTVRDEELFRLLRLTFATEDLFLEPSALAGFSGLGRLASCSAGQDYLARHGLIGREAKITHLAWATGGGMVPPEISKALCCPVSPDLPDTTA